MASFNGHIAQARKNLRFLSEINELNSNYWDWNVTVCFYVGVHLVNSHLAKTADLHYRKHEEVSAAINPYKIISPSKFPEDVYLAYTKLQNLSRRSRYLIHEDNQNRTVSENLTYDRHYKKALNYIDQILKHIGSIHHVEFEKASVMCDEARSCNFSYFIVK